VLDEPDNRIDLRGDHVWVADPGPDAIENAVTFVGDKLGALLISPKLWGESDNSIQQFSEDVLQVEEGSLYPALQRMLIKG
jgi:hypothetical protein